MNTRTYAHRLRLSNRNFVLYIFNIPTPVVVHVNNIHRARLCRVVETIYCVTFRRSFMSKNHLGAAARRRRPGAGGTSCAIAVESKVDSWKVAQIAR